jgi:hypothetical protein
MSEFLHVSRALWITFLLVDLVIFTNGITYAVTR